MNKQKLKVVVVFVQYEPEKHNGTFSRFRDIFARTEHEFHYVVIDNKQGQQLIRMMIDGTVLLGGDNSNYDFSGWQKGVQWLDTQNDYYDLLIIANDSYPLSSREYRGYLSDDLLSFLHGYGLCTGVIYTTNYSDWRRYLLFHPKEYSIGRYSFKYWIRSNFMVMPYGIRKVFESVNERTEDLLSAEYKQDEMFSNKVSVPLQNHISDYLCPAEAANQKYTWHSHFTLTPETYQHFRTKARVMLCEKLIAPSVLDLGSLFIDIRTIWIWDRFIKVVPGAASGIIEWMKSNPDGQLFFLFIYKRLIKINQFLKHMIDSLT